MSYRFISYSRKGADPLGESYRVDHYFQDAPEQKTFIGYAWSAGVTWKGLSCFGLAPISEDASANVSGKTLMEVANKLKQRWYRSKEGSESQ